MMLLVDLDNYKPTWAQRRVIQMLGEVYIGHYAKPGWSGELPFYAFMCKKHGVVVDCPHSSYETLSCPKCVDEKIKLIK